MDSGGSLEKIEQEYNDKNRGLYEKLAAGKKLTQEERYFLCDSCRTSLLLTIPICHDEFYIRFFLEYYSPTGLDHFEDRHFTYFKNVVREWSIKAGRTDNSNQLIKLMGEELTKQLKIHKKQNRIVKRGDTLERYLQERFDVQAWSKYLHLLIERTIFEEFPSGKYYLSLNNQAIVFNYYSLVHIITRHFGEAMKPFNQNKDHFHDTFYYNDIHKKLEDIFYRIDKSGVYVNQPVDEINFRYYGKLYKVFCKTHTFQEKGIPDEVALRLNSFFPVSDARMLERLSNEFTEENIGEALSVFIK